MSGRILLVDDDQDLGEVIVTGLTPLGFEVVWKASAEAALAALEEAAWDVVVTDISMIGMSGLALCERIVLNRPNLPVVLITAFGSLETAVGAVRAGAYDFVTKPFELDVLTLALERAVRHRQLHDEVIRLRDGAHHRPQRHRQGAGGAGAAPARPARGPRVRRGQLRGDPRGAPRERAVRAREGRLHRRPRGAPRPVPQGPRRHPVPRRDRRHAAGHAVQAPARAAGPDRARRRRRSGG